MSDSTEILDLTGNTLLPGACQRRYFVSYSGVRLPFRLISELTVAETENRNTYFIADFNDGDQLLGFDKVVYGEREMSHRYRYHPSGALSGAEVIDHVEDEISGVIFPDTIEA